MIDEVVVTDTASTESCIIKLRLIVAESRRELHLLSSKSARNYTTGSSALSVQHYHGQLTEQKWATCGGERPGFNLQEVICRH